MNQIAIMMTGFSGSGKSELADQIKKRLGLKMALFRTDAVRSFLSQVSPFFQDDFMLFSRNGFERQFSLKLRESITSVFLDRGFSVCIDRCFLAREERKQFIHFLRKEYPNVCTVLIYCYIPELELLKRLEQKDRDKIKRGGTPTWVDHYKKVQKAKFDPPQTNETNYFLQCDNTNKSEVLNELKKIIYARN